MSSWLASLPHQIPFRAASGATRLDDRTIEGVLLCSAGDALAEAEPIAALVFEAMAQIAGGLAFEGSGVPGFLSAIDGATISRPPVPGDMVRITATLEAEFQGIFRFSAVATVDGLECARAKFYLASAKAEDDRQVGS